MKLGIIGMSEGNGHPYSWAAICNGYSSEQIVNCPFPSIPKYLAEQCWPEAKIAGIEVSHIWTQDINLSHHIAKSCLINNVCNEIEDMIGHVDAVLLARDDAQQHRNMSEPFLKAGIPIFIDKPLALSLEDALAMLEFQKKEFHLFSCSSLKFAKELILNNDELKLLGEIYYVEAQTPKYWNTYAVHLLDPILTNVPKRGLIKGVRKSNVGKIHIAIVEWQNLLARITVYGSYNSPIQFTYFGDKHSITKTFVNSFDAFKTSIKVFIEGINNNKIMIPRKETLEIVSILEQGK
jgi:hypothetical protein